MPGPIGPGEAVAAAVRLLLVVFCVALLLVVVLTPLARALARSRGWLDRPDGRRKRHAVAVPRLGGAAVFLAFFGALALALPVVRRTDWLLPDVETAGLQLVAASGVMLLVGLWDDLAGVRPWIKLSFQTLLALHLYQNGYRILIVSSPFGDEAVPVGMLALPLTLLWFIGVSNAFNLIDGLDGLATGVAIFSASVVFIFALLNDRWEVALLSAALAGALLGFLRYNFTPATIFLGDSGALFVGFLLAGLSIRGSMKSSMATALLAPILAMGLPILDTAMTVLRRLARRKSVLEADDDHIHHRIVSRGFTPQAAVVLLYGVTALFCALSLLTLTGEGRLLSGVAVVVTAATWLGVRFLDYSELHTIPRTLTRYLAWRPRRRQGDPRPNSTDVARDASDVRLGAGPPA